MMSTGKRKHPVELSALDLVKRCAELRGIWEFEFRQKAGQLVFLDGRKFKYNPRKGDDMPILDDVNSERFVLAFIKRGIHAVTSILSQHDI